MKGPTCGWWWMALVLGVWLAMGWVGLVAGAGGAVCHCNCCAQLSGDCTDPAATAFGTINQTKQHQLANYLHL